MAGRLFLEAGDGVELIAPSRVVSGETVERAKDLVTSFGLKPYVQPYWNASPPHPLYAHEDDQRLESVCEALASKRSRAVWVLRGGYGATRLLPRLFAWGQSLSCAPAPKLLIGFSDVTALHLFVYHQWGWPSLHAPNLSGLVEGRLDPLSLSLLKTFLMNPGENKEEWILPLNDAAQQETEIHGIMVGGNHSVLQYTLGTPWEIKGQGKILFLEDVDEKAYRIDLRLEHFRQAGVFEGVQAIVFGDYTYAIENPSSEEFEKRDFVLNSFASSFSIPVLKMLGYGHEPLNKPLLLGAPAVLKTGKAPSLMF